jgi:hypothetical protein
MRLIAAGGDLLKQLGVRNPLLTSFRLNNLLTSAVFDMNPVQSLCGESPYTLEAGVRITVEWMRRLEFSRTKALSNHYPSHSLDVNAQQLYKRRSAPKSENADG